MSTQAPDTSSFELEGRECAPAAARGRSPLARKLGAATLAALPGALTLYLSFNSGGFFPGSQGFALAILAGALVLRMAFVRDPFAGFSRPLLIAVVALSAYALWALLSSLWSHAPARALLEFQLAAVYVFTVVLFGSTARSHRRVRWTTVLTWISMLVVCVAALASRLRPDLFPIPANLSPDRLAYPLSYWNALGLFAAIGLILASHFGSSTRERRRMRVLATSTIPLFAVTVLLTYSRAAIVIGIVGLVAYVLLARPRGALSTLLAAAPTSAFAIANTYSANLLSNGITSPAAVAQGRSLTGLLAAACVAAGLIRVALLEFDARFSEFAMSPSSRRNARSVLGLLCVAGLFVALLGFGGQISRQWHSFAKSDLELGSDIRTRIGVDDFRIGGRLPGWRIALQVFDRNPLHGRGAGTFPIDWYQLRPNTATAIEAHSLYLQAMSDLGLVGLIAVVVPVVLLIGACFVRRRRGGRSLWTVLGVVGLVWAIHAGLDWDWEMPAVTLPVFALTATALSQRGVRARLHRRVEIALRVAVALIAITVLVTGVRISLSDNDLDQSVAAFNAGNCTDAIQNARATISALSARPQSYQVIAMCDVANGHPGPSVGLVEQAIARDPQNWVYLYSLGIARASVGEDPGPALRQAADLDPHEPLIPAAEKAFAGGSSSSWERTAPHLEMLVTSTDN